MHKNRHFLSYRKQHHDAENHVHIYVHYVTLGSRCEMASNHRATDLDKIPFRISKDVGPLFISFLLFHLSRALLGAWRCNLFHSVYSSFHNRLDCIRSLPYIGGFILFSQFILVCFIIYVKMKYFCSF